MRRNLHLILAAVMIAFAFTAFAEISQTFEALPGYTMPVREQLKSENWRFPDFEINPVGVVPIVGANSMASGNAISPTQTSGVITPFLLFGNAEVVRFKYNLSRIFPNTDRRWFLVYLGDSTGNLTIIDSVEVSPSTTAVDYVLNVNNHSGTFVVYVNVRGTGGASKFIMDNFYFSGALAQSPSGFVLNPYDNSITKNTAATNAATNFMNTYVPGSNSEIITLFANPNKNLITIEAYSDITQSGRVEIYSEDGRKQIGLPGVKLDNGINSLNVDMSNLAPGNYFVNITTGKEVMTKRFTRVQ